MLDIINILSISTDLISIIKESYNQIQKKRLNIAFKLLEEKKLNYKQLIAEGNLNFIKKVVLIMNSIIETENTEKIELLCDLLVNRHSINYDEFEERIKIINDLSIKEIIVISTLYEIEKHMNPTKKLYELVTPRISNPDIEIIKQIWEKLLLELNTIFNISEMELNALINRLVRTGCINRLNSFGQFNTYAYLTPIFYNIFDFLYDNIKARIKKNYLK